MKEKKAIPSNEAAVQDEEIQVTKPETKGKKIASTIINVILVVAIVMAAASTYLAFVSSSGQGTPSIFGLQMFSIQTDSMYPTLNPGDLIFAVETDPAELQVGDIVTYWTVIDGQRALNTHRIHAIYDMGDGKPLFATKGDNNTSADPLNVQSGNIVGKYTGKLDGVGKFVDYLQTSEGFLIVVVIPVFIFFLFYLVQFFRVLFEYQNVKNRIKYEQERGRTEDLLAEQQRRDAEQKEQERAAMEAELREKLKAELLASMAAEAKAPAAPAEETPTEE